MYYFLIQITFLSQFMHTKDESFLECWKILQQIFEKNGFALSSQRGNYCSYYQENSSVTYHQSVIRTLKNVMKHLLQYRPILAGYKVIFDICDHQDLEQAFTDLRSIIVQRAETAKLWVTKNAADMLSSYVHFRVTENLFECQAFLNDSQYSLFTTFVATEKHIATISQHLKGVHHNTKRHTLVLFVADRYSGLEDIITSMLRQNSMTEPEYLLIPSLPELPFIDSLRAMLSQFSIEGLRKEALHDQEELFTSLQTNIDYLTDRRTLISPTWEKEYVMSVFIPLVSLYISNKKRLNSTPYIFIESVDCCGAQDIQLLDAILSAADPKKDIVLIGSATEYSPMTSVDWQVHDFFIDLRDYDISSIMRIYPHISLEVADQIEATKPQALIAFSQLLGEGEHSDVTNFLPFRPLLSHHRILLYILSKIFQFSINIEDLGVIAGESGLSTGDLQIAIQFLLHSGYISGISHLHLHNSIAKALRSRDIVPSESVRIDGSIALYFTKLHLQGVIQLSQQFLHYFYSILPFGYWVQNVYVHCERILSYGFIGSYLEDALFMKKINMLKFHKKHVVKPVVLMLKAFKHIHSRNYDALLECVVALKQYKKLPAYLDVPWLVVQAQHALFSGENIESLGKSLLAKTNEQAQNNQQIGHTILGLAALRKGMNTESMNYFSFAINHTQVGVSLHVDMFARLAMCNNCFLCGDFDSMRKYARTVNTAATSLAIFPWDIVFLFIQARLEFEIGYYKKASELFERAGTQAEGKKFTSLLCTCRCWEARSIGYAGGWSHAHKILRQGPVSMEHFFFLAEAQYFLQDYRESLKNLEKVQALYDDAGKMLYSTMFSHPLSWNNGWDALEHLFQFRENNSATFSRMIRTLQILLHHATGAHNTVLTHIHALLHDIKNITTDPNFSLYCHVCAEGLIEFSTTKSSSKTDHTNILSKAVRFLNERSSNIRNRFDRRHFISYNYWNNKLFTRAKEYNITD